MSAARILVPALALAALAALAGCDDSSTDVDGKAKDEKTDLVLRLEAEPERVLYRESTWVTATAAFESTEGHVPEHRLTKGASLLLHKKEGEATLGFGYDWGNMVVDPASSDVETASSAVRVDLDSERAYQTLQVWVQCVTPGYATLELRVVGDVAREDRASDDERVPVDVSTTVEIECLAKGEPAETDPVDTGMGTVGDDDDDDQGGTDTEPPQQEEPVDPKPRFGLLPNEWNQELGVVAVADGQVTPVQGAPIPLDSTGVDVFVEDEQTVWVRSFSVHSLHEVTLSSRATDGVTVDGVQATVRSHSLEGFGGTGLHVTDDFVYTPQFGTGTVSVFERQPDGSIPYEAAHEIVVGAYPRALMELPSSLHAVLVEHALVTYDPVAMTIAAETAMSELQWGMARGADDCLYTAGMGGVTAWRGDGTQPLTEVGTVLAGIDVGSISLSPGGTLLVAQAGNDGDVTSHLVDTTTCLPGPAISSVPRSGYGSLSNIAAVEGMDWAFTASDVDGGGFQLFNLTADGVLTEVKGSPVAVTPANFRSFLVPMPELTE